MALGAGECQKFGASGGCAHGGLTPRMATWRDGVSVRPVTGRGVSRRWLLVAAGAAALVGAVPLRDALPVGAAATEADDLRRRVLGSGTQAWGRGAAGT